MLFQYKALDQSGAAQEGTIEAVSRDVAIVSLQRRSLSISSIEEVKQEGDSFFNKNFSFFDNVSNRDVVLLSRQISTLFEAQVSALRVFRLLAAEAEKPILRRVLTEVADDLQAGSPISKSLGKHEKVFSNFYVNMVRSGEESGKLDETFLYLAEYLDRNYAVLSKARNALIYPAFVIATFVVVMILMMTLVIPHISSILTDAGQKIPVYTQVVIALSNFFLTYGIFLLILAVVGGFFLFRYVRTENGKGMFDRFLLVIPYVGELLKKLYLSRVADVLATMLTSGISMVQATEIAGSVVGNKVYEEIMGDVSVSIKGGGSVSETMARYPEIPGIMTAMVRVGEETGELGNILKTLAHFYQREVINAVDTLVDLIEPLMIVVLGLGVGILLASVLIPIYNISSAI
ncbi:type II secretion system F family protein [Candidatus Kaiserbacteria bacterium]|nr:type II secretion system F family protein [Candidatus Kaiserbacteria bacterium]